MKRFAGQIFLVATMVLLLGQVSLLARATEVAFRYRPDRILVKPKPGGGLTALASLHAGQGTFVLRSFADLDNLQVIQLAPAMTVEEAITRYYQSGQVEFAEPDYWIHAALEPDDPQYVNGILWGLHNTGQDGGVDGADINAPEGWDIRNSATNVVVAVIDSGVRYTHEDLSANMWTNPGEIPNNGKDDDRNGYADDVYGINALTNSGNPADDYGHGTHAAGIIGAVGNNGRGVTGVAWRVQIMACKFLDNTGNGSVSDAIQCLDYARLKGAKVINASWGDPEYSSALRSAIVRARDAGIVFVAAAGNDNQDTDLTPNYPASFDLNNIVAVTAITRTDALADFANYGFKSVDLAAPGSNIYSTWHTADDAYASSGGTSMAAPYVSGVLALMRAQFANETYKQLITRLLNSTDPIPALQDKCSTGGRINLQKALSPGLIADFTASPSVGATALDVHFTNLSFGAIASQVWDFGDGTPKSNEPNPSHTFATEGSFAVTLTVIGPNGMTNSTTRVITAIANYLMTATNFNWIDPSQMPALNLADNGVSPALALPFAINFYGQGYDHLFVSANGMMGFLKPGLETSSNSDLPNTNSPNAIICPYWDNLNPASNGSIHIDTIGVAPDRRVVVSWVGVPRNSTPSTDLTFQAVLLENSQQILFQYLEVGPSEARGGGRRATVGIENETGQVAVKYTFNGSPATLTNQQALVFTPTSTGGLVVSPLDGLVFSGPLNGPFLPEHQDFTIKNSANRSLRWSVSPAQDWITLSATNGALAAGQSTNVAVTVNTNAFLLASGSYFDAVTFMNEDSGLGNIVRTVTLNVHTLYPATLGPPRFVSTNQFQFRLSGEPGAIYRIETSTNLLNWLPVWTNNVPPEGVVDFTDPEAGIDRQRFYRAVQLLF
jgi:subtilisin family serine protease